MNKIDEKQKQINDIVSVVKLSSLLFSGMALLKFILNYFNIKVDNSNYTFSIQFVLAAVFILISIYFVWAFSATKKINNKYKNIISLVENLIFIIFFSFILLLSGAEKSQYKFLFLFIIITSTIQAGMKQGMMNACISSAILLIMDLVCVPNVVENIYFENDLIMAGVFILTAWPLGFYVKVGNEQIKSLESLANEDGLTGVYNHRFFHEKLKSYVAESEKDNNHIALIFMDVDYFKNYNDMYGHQAGDQVLKTIGALLKSSVRNGDIVTRYGGDEFAILLPGALEEEGVKIAESIRSKIESTHFDGEENLPKGKITTSMGISVYPDKAKNEIELIKYADDALYRAKFFNKNRVEIYHSILDELKKDIDDKHIDLVTSIKTLISVINAKDKYTYGHVERVVIYSRLLGEKLNLSEKDKKKLIYGAYMHDIGKINISEEVLNKKMPLTKDEWEILKHHPENGVEIIKPVESLGYLSPLILHHHERYDGTGYPQNLKGDEIPYLARILTVVDSFDAMTSNRPYSDRKTYEEAKEELIKCSNTQFDPHIANAFVEVLKENSINL